MLGYFTVENKSLIKIEKELKPNDWEIIMLFKNRFEILWKNWQDLGIKSINANFRKDNNGHYSGKIADLPNEFRLKGLYVDFRPFVLEKDEMNFIKVCDNLLLRITSSKNYNRFIEDTKQKFISDSSIDGWITYKGKDIKAKKIIETWFYATLFHFNRKKELNKMLKYFDNDTFQSLLFFSVYDCILHVKKIYWSISLLKEDFPYLRIPKRFIITNN
jgi:hypothetical protein